MGARLQSDRKGQRMNLNENSKRLKLILDIFSVPVSKAAEEIGKAAGRNYSRAYVSRVIHEGDFGSAEFFSAAERALPNIIAQKTVNLFALPPVSVEQLTRLAVVKDDANKDAA